MPSIFCELTQYRPLGFAALRLVSILTSLDVRYFAQTSEVLVDCVDDVCLSNQHGTSRNAILVQVMSVALPLQLVLRVFELVLIIANPPFRSHRVVKRVERCN